MAKRSKIKIETSGVADSYRTRIDSKIIEFSSPAGGGLIEFAEYPSQPGALYVQPYRIDETVHFIQRESLARVLADIDKIQARDGKTLADFSYDELAREIAARYEAGAR